MPNRDFYTDVTFQGGSTVKGLPSPTSSTDAANKAYVDSIAEGLSWKDSVRAASTANVTVSGPGAAIDGVTLSAGDRILLKDQSTASQNGIYIWNGAAVAATRASDATPFSELEAAVVSVEEGTTNAGTTWRQSAVNGTIDSSTVTWASFGTGAPSASETTAGIAELATQAETDTGTDDARIVTPLKLATWSGRKRKATGTVGDGSATSFNIDHNFATRDVVVEVYRNSGSYDTIECEVQRSTTNRVILVFASAPTTNQFAYTILG